ncbi:MAG: 3-oxoacyl-[acyl-carrier-protein] synthase-1, partial [Dokdonia sp.]
HLTATSKDFTEIENWSKALNLKGTDFPYINSLKSMVGHCLSASGALESVASVLQIHHNFIFPNINCEDVNEQIASLISTHKIPQTLLEKEVNIVAKASFGFGDVNGCILFKKFKK